MMNLISIRYHKIVDFESLFFVFVKIPGKANCEDIHPVKSSSKRHRFKPFEFRVKTANNLYCIVLSTYIPIQFAMSTPKSFALWRILQRSISERSSQWFTFLSHILCSWTRAHRADVHFNKHPHDLYQVPCGVCFQWFVPERSPSYPVCSWVRKGIGSSLSSLVRTVLQTAYG